MNKTPKDPAWMGRGSRSKGCSSIKRSFSWALILAIGMFSAPGVLIAQTSLADQQEQREQAERAALEREQRQAVPDIVEPGPERELGFRYTNTDLPDEAPCFQLNAVVLQGERLDHFDWVQSYLDQYIGRCVGQSGIGSVVRRASDLLLAKGYVTTRIGLPEQNLVEGTLTLVLVPGVIREIRFSDASVPTSLWKSAFPSRPGDLLNLRALEQGLEQLKRVPSQDATMEIVPGDKPGQSDVVIVLQHRKRWRAALTLDDAGSEATGKQQLGVTLWLDNPARRNDLLTLRLNHDASNDRGKGSRGYSAAYELPRGNWRFGLNGSSYHYHQTVLGATQFFRTSGSSKSLEVHAKRLLTRGQSYRTSTEMRIGQRRARSYIENVELDSQRRRTTTAVLALTHRQYWGAAQIDLRLAHRRGLPWLGGQDDASGIPATAPTFRYGMSSFDAALALPIAVGRRSLLWSSALRYQTSDDPTYASEYVTIGGRYSVQGFDGEVALAGRSGGYWRNSLSLSLHRSFAPYVGIDAGHIESNRVLGIAGGSLMGGYVGVRGDMRGAFSWDMFAGWPLRSPAGFEPAGRSVGFHLTYQL